MSRVTMAKVREMAAHFGCGFEEGSGYFYFVPPVGKCFKDSMVCVCQLNQLSLDQWEAELRGRLADSGVAL